MEKKIEAFERCAQTYEEWYRTPIGAYAHKAELKALRQLLPKTGLGAEMGSGTGIFAKDLTSEDRRVLCVDPSAKMVGQSKAKSLPTLLGIAEEPPVKERCLDFLYLVTVLEFLSDPVNALSSLGNLLKPRAPIVVLGINRHSHWGEAYIEASKRSTSVFMYSKIYTADECILTLQSAGYRISGFLMALDIGPNETPRGEPSTFLPQYLENGGVFILRGVSKKDESKDSGIQLLWKRRK